MNQTSSVLEKTLTLPSDQDASGRTLGAEEIALVSEAIRSGTLTSTKGAMVKTFEAGFAAKLGVKHAFACASGSAAVHIAVAAINPEPGDEIVTTSITDMGALSPIVFQGAIPVFCDVDPLTYNVTAKTIEAVLSGKTRAIIVTHLFGNPCEMDAIMELANARGIPVIEDCAQSFMSTYQGKNLGAIGAIGCFSLQQGKHMTTGEGGIVTTNDDALARHMFLFINKAWGYGDANPDHYFLALNYRMCELQGAVALGQLEKLEGVATSRTESAAKLTAKLEGIAGVEPPVTTPESVHTYWKYCLRIDDSVITDGAPGMARLLKERGIASAPRYIVKPAFMCEVFQKQRTFGNSRWPFTLARPEAVDYAVEKFPGTYEALHGVLVLPWNELYTDEHIEYIAAAVRDAAEQLKN